MGNSILDGYSHLHSHSSISALAQQSCLRHRLSRNQRQRSRRSRLLGVLASKIECGEASSFTKFYRPLLSDPRLMETLERETWGTDETFLNREDENTFRLLPLSLNSDKH